MMQQGRSQDVFERRVEKLGYRRRIVLHSPHFMSVPFLVAESDLITVVPLAVGRIYARLLKLRTLPVPFDVPSVELRRILACPLAWRPRQHMAAPSGREALHRSRSDQQPEFVLLVRFPLTLA